MLDGVRDNPGVLTVVGSCDHEVTVSRMLVWDRGDAIVVGHNDPREPARSYDVADHAATLESMASRLADLAREAAAGEP